MSTKVPKLVKTVACVLNGTRESAVCAYFLHNKGFRVTGVNLENIYLQPEDNSRHRQYAIDVCHHLDIPHAEITLDDDCWTRFNQAVQESYKKGLNPDLDILFTKHILTSSVIDYCNRHVDVCLVGLPFFTRSDFGFDSPLHHRIQGTRLSKPMDINNDESFLLTQTPGDYLERCVFPMGELPREAIDMMASMTSLDAIPTYSAPIPHDWNRSAPSLVNANLIPKELMRDDRKGKLIDMISGKTVSHHNSFYRYYPGLGVFINGQTFYVTEKNATSGDVFLVDDPEHPAFLVDTFFTSLANWPHMAPHTFYHEKQMMDCAFKTRKDAAPVDCSITVGALNEYCGNDHIIVSSSQPVKAVVPGQFCAFYSGEECLGSASIFKPGPSHYAMNYKKYKSKKGEGWKGWFS